jgi:hypothetical protein
MRVAAGCVPGGRGVNSCRPRVAPQISSNECRAARLIKNEDHLPSLSGIAGQNALGVGRCMSGVLGGGRLGKRRRTLSGAFAASSCGSKGRPELGGKRQSVGGEGGTCGGADKASNASASLRSEVARSVRLGGLDRAPASGPHS